VSESVRPKNLVNTISQKTNEGNFTQFWSQNYLGS